MTERLSRRRVKLYALNDDRQWDDKGTGHVHSTFVERFKGMSLLVRAETNGELLLESKIKGNTVYQKQQGTLIVWSEEPNYDLALSFQEKAGCDEIWEKICQVQGKDPSVETTQEITNEIVEEEEEERYDDVGDKNIWVELPPCELSRLEDINEAISTCLHSPNRRDKISVALENEVYIKDLIKVFHMCEDLNNTEALHLLYEIFKNIFLLNKNALFEIMFADDTIFDVIGALEYDPACTNPKKHRHYLKSIATFKEVIPIENTELRNKIHQTYRVQYIQDVVLPTPQVFEENMLSTLSSFVYFNKVEIVSLLQEDHRFMTELFNQLCSNEEDVPAERRRDLVLFLKEFCLFSQTLQPQARESFLKTLSSLGILSALEITLSIDDAATKSASIDILSYIVEYSPSVVREYMMQQDDKVEEEQYLINIIIEQMVVDSDPQKGGASQLMGILRILLDPENMLGLATKSEKSDFLQFFYKHSMHYLIAPVLATTMNEEVSKENYQIALLLTLILELLGFCVEHHTFYIKNFIVHRELLKRILVLMKSKHTFLVLGALRFLRKIIGMKDDYYNRHITGANLFAPVIDAFMRNNGRYNLLDSAITELFEYIQSEDLKILLLNVVENFGSELSEIDYVQTFQQMRNKYEQHLHKIREKENNTSLDSLPGNGTMIRAGCFGAISDRIRRDIRDMDADEERYFNDDDPDDAETNLSLPIRESTSPLPPTEKCEKEASICKNLSALAGKTNPLLINNSNKDNNNTSTTLSTELKTAHIKKKISLVDYDENSDEEEEETIEQPDQSTEIQEKENEDVHIAKRARITTE